MDYEKKYKILVERIKGDYAAYKSVQDIAGMDALESIFPELSESEDEKIRKELLDIIQKSYELGGFTLNSKKDLERYVSWLEKQKEQKTADDRYMEGYMRGIGEQKPAEWSEEDEKMCEEAIRHIRYALCEQDGSYSDDEPVLKWIKSLKDRIKGR